MFESFFLKAFDDIVSLIKIFSQLWYRTECSLSALTINNGFQMSGTVRETTMKIYVQCLKQRLLAVCFFDTSYVKYFFFKLLCVLPILIKEIYKKILCWL